ncbi:tetraacyldisaccharide 4'-kinase [Seonamhaeicola sp. ML3]|uniref:tetraacyldisaccharide 4'-kinase n=1 Tax=Seonamhaeicola sp. ML3 TaxID=2937786 RepID=UPI00200F9E28|nr:tetraacyldisaccharide 4'-kinase [Seonamhaeicola sp. ML3]
MKIIRYIAFPFVPAYYLVTCLRNKLYDSGIKKSTVYDVPVICVGNLSVGGTGKTPMIEYLINLLKTDFRVATLSRGYKRKTQGFQLADENSNAESIGDEPFQFYNKFKGEIMVSVDADRNNGIKNLLSQEKSPEVILLDDAFQHRKVKAGFNILLTTYSKPYFNDIVLPTGDLREPRSGAQRADVIVVTKCPDNLSDSDKQDYLERIKPKDNQDVFFSSIVYSDEVVCKGQGIKLEELPEFTLVTGIANASPMLEFLNTQGCIYKHLNYKDHHEFSKNDIQNLEKEDLIVTTEKDFMRLKQYESLKEKLYYLPIKVSLDNEKAFDIKIKRFIASMQ